MVYAENPQICAHSTDSTDSLNTRDGQDTLRYPRIFACLRAPAVPLRSMSAISNPIHYKSVSASAFSITGEDDDDSEADSRASRKVDVRKRDSLLYNLWQGVTFQWIEPLLAVGNHRPLEQEDLYQLARPDSAVGIYSAFRLYWSAELAKRKKNSDYTPSLALVICNAFGYPFFAVGFLKLVHDSCIFVGPLMLHRIISFLGDASQPSSVGFVCCLWLFLSQLTMSICLRSYFYWCFRTGMRLRSAIVTSVFCKALVLSTGVFSRRSAGEISNLMSVDSTRLQDLTPYLHSLWYSFFQVVVALYFLWQQVGAASLAGVAVIIITTPVTGKVSSYLKSLQRDISKLRDERIKLTNEVLSGMKTIKFQAWERQYIIRLGEVRDRELALFRKYTVTQAFNGALYNSLPLLVAAVTFIAYVATGHELGVATALTSLALFDILRFPLVMLPATINSVVEAMVSLDRVSSFLLEPERQPVVAGPLGSVGVAMSKASFNWEAVARCAEPEPQQDSGSPWQRRLAGLWAFLSGRNHMALLHCEPETMAFGEGSGGGFAVACGAAGIEALRREQLLEAERVIALLESRLRGGGGEPGEATVPGPRLLAISRASLSAESKQMVAIVGPVGSGKSSLLSALLGDMHALWGEVNIRGSVAYCAQRPFIQNATLRNNVLFGLPLDEARYARCLADCALQEDLAALPSGDLTEIGERGINLSGGQKARVALARALYADKAVYLLDDVLAAVDSRTGAHLFQSIARLRSEGKCVLFVTSAVQLLRSSAADKVVVLEAGRVTEEGSYASLVCAGGLFARMAAVSKESELARSETDDEAPSSSSRLVPGAAVAAPDVRLVEDEERNTGDVGWRVYGLWAEAAGGTGVLVALVSLFCLAELVNIAASWWLSYWSEHKDTRVPWLYLGVYIFINAVVSAFMMLRELFMRLRSWRAGKTLHAQMLAAVVHAPMAFFDATLLGRLTNRFSKDIYVVDEQLPNTVRWYVSSMAKVAGVVAYIVIVTPPFLLALIPICAGYVAAQRYYIKTSRELTRLDSTSRSPIYALFQETLDGLSTVRAFCTEEAASHRCFRMLDRNQQAYYLNFSANCWLGVRLELAGNLIITGAAVAAVLARNYYVSRGNYEALGTFSGMAGLSISLALSVTQSLNWSVRMASDLESQMVSVERVDAYSKMPQELPHDLPTDPPADAWPSEGRIDFEHVCLRYRPGLPLALDDVTFSIRGAEKIGVVGRTGSGKSTLVTALLRLVEAASGRVTIDGLDAASVGLHALRSRMAVIPQDPVLFSGTVRSNLDPFGAFSDAQLFSALGRCMLADSVSSLDDPVLDGGANFSVGQRQLMCFARALLSSAKIIVCDEATSAVDVLADNQIQKCIRQEFKHTTTITVAHRLNTIIDSDRILVLDGGKMVEFDSPQNLLADGKSYFADLVRNWNEAN